MTANALFFYAIGLFAYGGVKATVQAFYSMKDTVTPMKIAIVNVALNITLNIILIRYLGLVGLALVTSVSSSVSFVILGVMLKRRLGDIRGGEIWLAVVKILIASAIMGFVLYYVSMTLDGRATNIWGKLAQVGISLGAGLGTFLIVSFVMKVKEVIFILGLVFGSRSER